MAELVTPFSGSCNILTFCLIALKQHLSFGARLVFDKTDKSLFSFSHTFKVWHLLREDRGSSHMEIKMSALLPIELLENVVPWCCAPAWHRLTHPVTALEKHSLDHNAEAANRPERAVSFRWAGLRGRRVAKPSILFLKTYSAKTGRSKWRSRKKARALGHWNTKQEENTACIFFFLAPGLLPRVHLLKAKPYSHQLFI